MATFGSPLQDTASNYTEEMYGNPDNRFGVRNAQVDRGTTERTLNSRPSEDGRRKRIRPVYSGVYEDAPDDNNRQEERVEKRYYQPAEREVDRKAISEAKISGTSIFARSRAVYFVASCGSISLFIAPIQLIFLMTGIAMMGMASQTEESWTAWLAQKTIAATSWIFGFEFPDLMAFATGSLLLAGLFGLISLFGFVLWAVLLRLHPLYGKGASIKTPLFMLAVILSMIPFGSMPWILSVLRYPK